MIGIREGKGFGGGRSAIDENFVVWCLFNTLRL